MSRPNLLFILTDQQRTDTLGCYGSPVCQTPHLDALAQEGTVFERAYCVAPICTPARASLQTGVYPFKHGMASNIYRPGCQFHELADGPHLLSRQLENQVYSCGFTGKWHLGFGDDKAEMKFGDWTQYLKQFGP